MTYEQLHAHCETVQQALIDLIAAVLDVQDSQEWTHLQTVLDAAREAVQEDVPPLDQGAPSVTQD